MDDDPSQYSISRVGQSFLPIFVPWQREQKRITSGFDSRAVNLPGGPWKQESPFDRAGLLYPSCQTILETGRCRDTEGHSGSNSITNEHDSGHLGIAVGNAAVKVGVSSSYDRQMQDAANASRASHNSRLRCGSIALMKDPPLSSTAKTLLQEQDGLKLFSELYGDYFVAGYVLGADSGACLAVSSSSNMSTKTVTITVEVKVLWSEFTSTASTTDVQQSASSDLAFYGYDTLDNLNVSLSAGLGQPNDHIRAAARLYMEKTNTLQSRLKERLRELDIKQGNMTSVEQCRRAVDEGIVVELMLVPYRSLKEYVECYYKGARGRAIAADIEASPLSLKSK
ncbi:hypothetical protein V8C35DRAFT_306789 [Trichoderma chlorosporum]